MSDGLYSGVSGLAIGIGLYKGVSGLWSGASGLLADWDSPFAGASLYLNMLSGSLDSRVTFSRGTNATLTDSTGKITYAPANLLLRSQEFDDAYWTKTDTAVTANSTVAPDGTTTADKLSASATTATHVIQRVPTVTPGVRYTASVFLAAAEMTTCVFNIGNAGGGFARYAVDLQAGTGTLVSSGSQTLATATITPAGNGFYRVAITLTAFVGGNSGYFIFQVYPNTDASFTGNGTDGIFIWGAQLEPVTYQTTAGPYVATTSAAYYGPRFDYDPVTLQPKGILIEEQRTNLQTYSQGAFNTQYIKVGTPTVSDNSATGPAGPLTASAVSGAGVADYIYRDATATIGVVYTRSLYVSNVDATQSRLLVRSASSAADVYLNWTGSVLTSLSVSVGAASFVDTGNGIYRVILVYTALETTDRLRITPNSVTGTKTINVYGAQLEAGAFATSYIPTVASQVTRSADVATMTGTNFSTWYNQTEGSFAAQFSSFGTVEGTVLQAGVSQRFPDRVAFYTHPQNYIVSNNAGESQAALGNATLVNATARISGAYKQNDFAVSINGAAALTDTSGTVPAPISLAIGYRATASPQTFLNGHIRQIAYYNTRLPNDQLQALTT